MHLQHPSHNPSNFLSACDRLDLYAFLIWALHSPGAENVPSLIHLPAPWYLAGISSLYAFQKDFQDHPANCCGLQDVGEAHHVQERVNHCTWSGEGVASGLTSAKSQTPGSQIPTSNPCGSSHRKCDWHDEKKGQTILPSKSQRMKRPPIDHPLLIQHQ